MIQTTAIILAGGKSLRMGTNKLLLKIDNEPVIKKIANLCKSNFDKTIIITNSPVDYEWLNIQMYEDVYPNYGPLSGIHTGLKHSLTENNFVLSADMPFINKSIIEFLLKKESSKEIILPKSENIIHSLCGIYKKKCVTKAEELLKIAEKENAKFPKTKVKLFDLINALATDIIDVSKEIFYHKDLFLNMNTLEDYNYVKKILSKYQC